MKPYYEHAGITIFHGDCREVLPSLVADAVVTDPPYGVGLAGKRAKQRDGGVTVRQLTYGMIDDTEEYVESVVVPVIRELVAHGGRVALTPGTRCMWLYPKPVDVGCFFSAAGTGMGSWGFSCCQPILYYGKCPFLERALGSRPNSLGQTYPNDANEVAHPCAKPLRQWRWLVNRVSLDGETVMDPFMGSGTTLLAAKGLGRNAIGIEIEERYCEIAAKRLQQEVLPLFEPEPEPVFQQGALLEV